MKENKYSHSTAADLARATGWHRTTIVEKIKAGEITVVNITVKSKKKNHNKHWKIQERWFAKGMVRIIKKRNPRHGTIWDEVEKYILRNNLDESLDTLQKLLPNRKRNSIKIKRCRIRKEC